MEGCSTVFPTGTLQWEPTLSPAENQDMQLLNDGTRKASVISRNSSHFLRPHIHPRHVDADASVGGGGVSLQRRAGSVRGDRDRMLAACFHYGDHILRGAAMASHVGRGCTCQDADAGKRIMERCG